MPLVEIEDDVLKALAGHGLQFRDAGDRVKRATEVEAAWNKLLGGPNRTQMLKAYKEAYPDAVVPELDAAAPITAEVSRVEKKFDDWVEAQKKEADERREKNREEAANSTVAKGRTWLRADKKLDDEGVTAVEQIMQEHGIPNYEVAFNHWNANRPPDAEPLPSAYGGARSLDWFKVEEERPDTKLLINDPKAFQRRETGKVLQEIREGKLAAA